jgi:FSR family fosmidomycin resistance protein-like MFS transporter
LASDRKKLLMFAAAHLADDVYMNAIPPFVPVLVSASGLSFAAAGLLVTFFTVASSVTQPLLGYVADRFRYRWLSGAGLIWVGSFIALLGLGEPYALLLLVAALAGLGPALFHPPAISSVSTIATRARGRLMATFLVGGNLGFAAGPVLVGLFTTIWGLRGMLAMGLPGLLMGGYLLRRAPAVSVGTEGDRVPSPRLGDISPAAVLFAVAVLRAWVYLSAVTYVPAHFVAMGNSILRSNSYVTFMLLAGVIGQFIGGSLSDLWSRKKVTGVTLFLTAPLFLLFLHTTGTASLVFLFLFGFFLMGSFSVTLVMAQELMPKHVAMASGMMIGFAVGLGGVGVLLTGMLADAVGVSRALHALAALSLIGSILVPFIPHGEKG